MEDQPKEEEQKKVSDEPENKEEQNDTNTTEEHKEEEHKEEEPNEEKNEIKENAVTEEEKNLEEEKEKEEQLRKEKEEQERKEKEEQERKEKEEKERLEQEEKSKKNFEKNLWNKYEFLHKRYRTKIEYFENTIDVFSRLMSSLKDHQKAINTIINKNYNLFPGADFTQSNALNMLKKGLEIEFGQLTTTLEIFKKTLIEQFKKHKDDVKSKEKDAYNQFVKIMSKYNDSKVVLEKNKNKYHQSVKVAELSLKNSKSMKVKNIDNSQESQVTIQKLETKATELLNEAKKNYDEYYNRQKEQNEAQRNFLVEMDKAIKDIDLSKDNLALINANISEEKPDEVIPLVQYEPQIDFEKAPSPEEYKINHEIIKALKTSIPDIMPNFDIEKENQKQEMRELSKKIFVTNIPFTEEEKNKLMEYLQQKWSQTYFLIYLSKQRTNGRFARTQKLVNDLAEILNLILKSAHKEKDYHAAKNCMILSQTYYYDEKDKEGNTKKKYLLEFILNDSWLRSPEFWRGIIEEMINFEAKKYMELNPKEHSLFDTNNKSSVDKLSNICFSQLLPYTNNMKEFFIDDRLIVKIIDEYVEKYCIQKELADTIYAGVISEKPEEVEKLRKEYKDNPNFENELMTLEEVKKQKGVI